MKALQMTQPCEGLFDGTTDHKSGPSLRSGQALRKVSLQTMRLSELNVGEAGTIVKLAANGGFRQRLLEMGFVRGERIEVKRVAPLGDPVEYSIKDYHLALRRREAECILVEVALA